MVVFDILCAVVATVCYREMYTVAVVVPNPKNLQELADSLKISCDWSDLCSNPEITEHVLKQMKSLAQGLYMCCAVYMYGQICINKCIYYTF